MDHHRPRSECLDRRFHIIRIDDVRLSGHDPERCTYLVRIRRTNADPIDQLDQSLKDSCRTIVRRCVEVVERKHRIRIADQALRYREMRYLRTAHLKALSETVVLTIA